MSTTVLAPFIEASTIVQRTDRKGPLRQPSTIRSHTSSIYRKLRVRSRDRAVLEVGIDNIDFSAVAEETQIP